MIKQGHHIVSRVLVNQPQGPDPFRTIAIVCSSRFRVCNVYINKNPVCTQDMDNKPVYKIYTVFTH